MSTASSSPIKRPAAGQALCFWSALSLQMRHPEQSAALRAEIAQSAASYAELCRHIFAVGVVLKTTSRIVLHHACYKDLRRKHPDIPSQWISLAIHRASRMLRDVETGQVPSDLVLDLDGRVASLRAVEAADGQVRLVMSLRLMGGRYRLYAESDALRSTLPDVSALSQTVYHIRQGHLLWKDAENPSALPSAYVEVGVQHLPKRPENRTESQPEARPEELAGAAR
jgi:hypothetical protein